MTKVIPFIKKNIVCIIAFTLALISIFFIHPDKEYLNYINYDTIGILFMTMLIVGGFKNIRSFEKLSLILVTHFKTMRKISYILIIITFIGSMILANDMALLTFIPLSLSVLAITKEDKYAPFIITMQVIAANLGGMLTPFGNPQNMYLYSYYQIQPFTFISIMFWPFLLSIILIFLSLLYVKNAPVKIEKKEEIENHKYKFIFLSVLFLFAIITIFRIIPLYIGFVIVVSLTLIVDYKAILKVDYGLLLTFIFFFIFTGNLARISFINEMFSNILVGNELLVGVCSCQFISNVPSAILLSKFTTNFRPLLIAVNIGGLGTLIASLASLIAYKQYVNKYHKHLNYLITFSILNFSFLIILLIFSFFLFA